LKAVRTELAIRIVMAVRTVRMTVTAGRQARP
jgi:hypothetical protein